MATLAVAKPPSGARKPSVSSPVPTVTAAPNLPLPTVAQTEVARHLPTLQSFGTFFNGRRIATPTGEAVVSRRPASALVCSNRGVSVGAEVRRLGDPAAGTNAQRAPVSFSACEQFVLEAADVLALTIPPGCEPAALGPRVLAVDLTSHSHVQWRDVWMHSGAALCAFPFTAAGIPNPRRLDMILRAATLISALLRYKNIIESGQLPSKARCGRSNATSSLLFNQNFSVDATGRRVVTYRDNTRHIIVSCGGNHFAVEVQEAQGRWLTSSEIANRLQLVADLAAGMKPSLFAKMCWLAADDYRDVTQKLRGVCAANAEGLAALTEAIFAVTLLPDTSIGSADRGDDDEHIPTLTHLDKSPGSWLGAGLQLFVDNCGQAVVQSHTTLVNPHIVFDCANQIANFSKEDALRPYVEPTVDEVVAVVRPFVPSKPVDPKEATQKKVAGFARLGEEDGPKCFEVVCPLQATSSPCRAPIIVDLWLPVARVPSVSARPLCKSAASTSFWIALAPRHESVLLLAVLAAFHIHVRQSPVVWYWEVDGMTRPNVWLANSRATALALGGLSCPGDISAATKRYTTRRRCDAAVADLHCRFVAPDASRGPPFVSILSAASSPSKLASWSVGLGGCCSQADLVISRATGRYPNAAWEVSTTQAELGARTTLSYTVLEGGVVCTFSSRGNADEQGCLPWIQPIKATIQLMCEALRDSSIGGRQ